MAKPAHEKAPPSSSELALGLGEDWLLDRVTEELLPAKGHDQAERDAKDAKSADQAFTIILAATVTAIEGSVTAMHIVASVFTLGGAAAPGAAAHAAVIAAAAATRIAWERMPLRDRARIWRGEL